MRFLTRFFASFAGVGFIPGAPGTWGSLVAALILFLLAPLPLYPSLALLAVLTVAGAAASGWIEKDSGLEDPGWIVIDEVVGMWIAVLAVPAQPIYFLTGFLFFRIFDIWKPWIIDDVQSLPKGWGVMADDVLAGLAALIFNLLLWESGFFS